MCSLCVCVHCVMYALCVMCAMLILNVLTQCCYSLLLSNSLSHPRAGGVHQTIGFKEFFAYLSAVDRAALSLAESYLSHRPPAGDATAATGAAAATAATAATGATDFDTNSDLDDLVGQVRKSIICNSAERAMEGIGDDSAEVSRGAVGAGVGGGEGGSEGSGGGGGSSVLTGLGQGVGQGSPLGRSLAAGLSPAAGRELGALRAEGIEKTKGATRHYAKRQLTWIRNRLMPIFTKTCIPVFDVNSADLSAFDSQVSVVLNEIIKCIANETSAEARFGGGLQWAVPTQDTSAATAECTASGTANGTAEGICTYTANSESDVDRVTHKRKIFQCQDCDGKCFQGLDQYEIHTASKKHYKRVAANRKRKKREISLSSSASIAEVAEGGGPDLQNTDNDIDIGVDIDMRI
jgi:hypothetical protein